MPALPPPSMQIGAPQPGYAPYAVTGPMPGMNATPGAYPQFYQSAGATTTISGPTNISQTVTATRQNTLLVWAVAVNASAAAALGGTPTGWTLATSTITATLALGLYVMLAANNPGGIASVTFSSNATATTGGIASWFWEVPSAPFAIPSGGAHSTNGATSGTTSGSAVAPTEMTLVLGATAWVLGASTWTVTQGGSGWVVNAQQSSTNGTTNAALQTGQNYSGLAIPPTTIPFGGTLSVAAQWCGANIMVPVMISGQLLEASSRAIVIDNGNAYGCGDTGMQGFALGATKPGGAGSGQ